MSNLMLLAPRKLHSEMRDKDVYVNDNCGCESGGFYEQEETLHGFHGSIVWKKYFIHCNTCKKTLPEISPEEYSEYIKSK